MDNPLVDLKDLTKPITKLIEVTSKGIGRLYAPIGTVRQANADAKAKLIHAVADEEIKSLELRSKNRVEHIELQRQENIESILVQAARELPEDVSDQPVNEDWTRQFFNAAQDVCDEDMQKLWSRVLAGEVSSPGSYSKRTLEFLRTMDKSEAEVFTTFISFSFGLNHRYHCFIDHDVVRTCMNKRFGPQDVLGHLVSIGLLSPGHKAMFASKCDGRDINYFDKNYKMAYAGPVMQVFEDKILYIPFSLIGQQLSIIAGAKPIEGFADDVFAALAKDSGIKFIEI